MPDIEFMGERFRTADKIGLMPMMRFAKVAKAGVDAAEMDGLAALYDLLEQCIADDDWERFQGVADKHRADGGQLMHVVGGVFEALSARPTSQPSDSSAGLTITPQNSAGDSSSQVVTRLEGRGRPDLALMVTMAEETRSAVSA